MTKANVWINQLSHILKVCIKVNVLADRTLKSETELANGQSEQLSGNLLQILGFQI